jgi:hypothetical protein
MKLHIEICSPLPTPVDCVSSVPFLFHPLLPLYYFVATCMQLWSKRVQSLQENLKTSNVTKSQCTKPQCHTKHHTTAQKIYTTPARTPSHTVSLCLHRFALKCIATLHWITFRHNVFNFTALHFTMRPIEGRVVVLSCSAFHCIAWYWNASNQNNITLHLSNTPKQYTAPHYTRSLRRRQQSWLAARMGGEKVV